MIASGTPDGVLHHPAVVASYLGTSQAAIQRSGTSLPPIAAAATGEAATTTTAAAPPPTPPPAAPTRSRGGEHEPHLGGGLARVRAYAGPLATVMAVFAFAVVGGLGRGPGQSASEPPKPGDRLDTTQTFPVPLTFTDADRRQQDTTPWVANCDVNTGRIRMPSVYAPPCVPAFDPATAPGGNGGATYQGVTADTITIAVYVPQAGDLRQIIQNAIDPQEQIEQTGENYVEMFDDLFETYGRSVDLVQYDGTGAMDDEVAARSDAIRIIEEVKPFAVIGGPPLTTAFAEELAIRGVLCFDCGLAMPDSFHQDNAPFIWGPLPTPEEFLTILGDFLFSRVQNLPASFAGDPDMRDQER